MNAFDSLRGFGPYGSKPNANVALKNSNSLVEQPFDEAQVFEYLQRMYPDMAPQYLVQLGKSQMQSATDQMRKATAPKGLAPGQRLRGFATPTKSNQQINSVGANQRLF
jgi:hypothetical protein